MCITIFLRIVILSKPVHDIVHIKIMFQSVLYAAVCVVLHLVASQYVKPNYQHEERIKSLANQIERVVESEAMKIALAKDAMEETVNDAVESIEEQLVKLHQIADAIRLKNLNKSCLQTTVLISNINLDPLRACNYSSRFEALNQVVGNAATLYATLKNVTQTCESDNCENQLLDGVERSISELSKSVNESLEQISSSYLGCIQEELAAIDKTLNEIGHQAQQCV
ncbi:unnamed protein product [Callosobruchus maculatus]|uniref:Uncharacterized protein n=1 Tax=Callosobruchus maculatus TaxID=64391 RepID=A0A653DQG8_CALMS|nr:unnamed protein product [Callosobruchus maculatus]